MNRLDFDIEKDMVIDIIGESLMNCEIIIEKLEKKGINFGPKDYKSWRAYPSHNRTNNINQFIDDLIIVGVIRNNPDVDVISSIFTDNDYCLTVPYLREYKLNKILS